MFRSGYAPQCFAWQAALLAEQLIEQENIDIIEAQEFEAPLYYLQLRRALGIAPQKQPLCIVHLHTSTEFVVQNNGLDIGHPYFLTAKRLEDYSISAADALLSPSQFLAGNVASQFDFSEDNIRVIPYPISEFPVQKRNAETWQKGKICYVGRLEERKGVIEWIEAAVTAAENHPTEQFEFIGSNTLGNNSITGEVILNRLIPDRLRDRFLFRGKLPRAEIPDYLAKTRIAVVPSRWENFPNTCIEAMCSGLPVLTTRTGGMAEMVEDNRSGWLADRADSKLLTETLQRALNTPPQKLAEMGNYAATAIRRKCDTENIITQQLDFRREVIEKGVRKSSFTVKNLDRINKINRNKYNDQPTQPPVYNVNPAREKTSTQSITLIITSNDENTLKSSLKRLKKQTKSPENVIIVKTNQRYTEMAKVDAIQNILVIHKPNAGIVAAKNIALQAVLDSTPVPLGIAFLSQADRLEPRFIEICQAVLERCPGVGLVSGWVYASPKKKNFLMHPTPEFPYQWIRNEVAPFSMIRTAALQEAGGFRMEMASGYEDWDLFNAILAQGWQAVTVPEVLGSSQRFHQAGYSKNVHQHLTMRRLLLERFPELAARDGKEIALLTESIIAHSLHIDHLRLLGGLDKMRALIGRRIIEPLFDLGVKVKRLLRN